jgi:hypothetical protein
MPTVGVTVLVDIPEGATGAAPERAVAGEQARNWCGLESQQWRTRPPDDSDATGMSGVRSTCSTALAGSGSNGATSVTP